MNSVADRVSALSITPRLVVLDLDGTLVDTVPDLAVSADAMLADLGHAPCGEARVREWVGNGVERLVKRVLTGSLDGEPEPHLFDRALKLFMAHYAHNTSTRSRVYPGAFDTLDYFRRLGVPLVCITNKPAVFTEKLLDELHLRRCFDLVLSGDTLARKKPDPLPLQHAAERFGLLPNQCLMVGDSKTDVAAARAAGASIICVSYGYNHGEDIHTAGADAVIDSLDELPAQLNGISGETGKRRSI